MTAPTPSTRSLPLPRLSTAVVAVLALVWAGLLAHNSLTLEGGFTPDSVIYINSAENIAGGEGYSRSIVELYRLIDRHERMPLPVTQWAPLYPSTIALTGRAVDPRAGALLVSALALVPLLLAAGVLAGRIAGTPAALLCMAFFTAFSPLEVAALHAWSETLALAFMFSALACLPFRSAAPARLGVLGMAGLLAGLACATRFALLPLPVIFLTWIGWRRPMVPLRNVVGFALPCIFIVAPALLRNIYLAANIGGAPWGSGRGTVGNGIGETARALMASGPLTVAFCVAVIVAAAIIATTTRKKIAAHETSVPVGAILFLAVWVVAYLTFLVVAQARVRVDPIDTRLTLPATLSLIVAASCAIPSVFRVLVDFVSSRGLRSALHFREGENPGLVVAAVSAVIIVIASIVPEFNTARNIRSVGAIPPHDAGRTLHRIPVLAWLSENAAAEDLVVAEDALDYPFYLGPMHIAFFSETHQPGRYLDYDETLDYLIESQAFERYTRIFLVLRPDESHDPEEDNFRTNLLANSLGRYPGITLAARLDDAVIFRWREVDAP